MMFKLNLLAFVVAAFFQCFIAAASAEPKVCVLNYEREIHPFTRTLKKVFANNPHVELINESVPDDFFRCLEKGVTEIVILAHAFEIRDPEREPYFRLGYFKRMVGDDRKSAIDEISKGFQAQIDEETKRLSGQKCSPSEKAAQHMSCLQANFKLNRLNEALRTMQTLKDDRPIFQKKYFFNKTFEKAVEWATNIRKSGAQIPLKNIRFIGCLPHIVLPSHAPLQKFISENNVNVDVAPKQQLLSWLTGHYGTFLDEHWVEETAQFEDLSDGFFAYLKAKTVVLGRWGETIAFHGQYRIRMRGVGVGLSSKFTKLYIKFSEVQGMSIGEKRNIIVPHFDIAAAFWANGEVQIGRKPQFIGTSEINSIGFSVGILQDIEIERLY